MNSGSAGSLDFQRPSLLNLPADRSGSGVGQEAVELAASAGLILDAWQEWFLVESLAEQRNGKWSASEVGLLVSRQNGKGSALEARQLAGLFLLDESLAIHTAHEYKTCYEHFLRITRLIENTPDLDRLVQQVRKGAGEHAVELKSGARLRFLARSGGSGRGFPAPTVYLDEAFALTAADMGALTYTMSAQSNPQIWQTSSAPKRTSTVLANLIKRAKAGNEPRLLFAMWAASADGSRWDQDRWAQANPAFPHRISPEAIATELRQCGDDVDLLAEFDRERLGIPEMDDETTAVIPLGVWDELVDDAYAMRPPARIALDVAPDSRSASFVAAQADGDGVVHIEVVHQAAGTDWVKARALEVVRAAGTPLLLAANSPAASKAAELRAAGVDVVEMSGADVTRACQAFVDRATARTIRHRGGDGIRSAIVGAAKKLSTDTWTWSRRSSTVDITPLVAATLAVAAAETEQFFVY